MPAPHQTSSPGRVHRLQKRVVVDDNATRTPSQFNSLNSRAHSTMNQGGFSSPGTKSSFDRGLAVMSQHNEVGYNPASAFLDRPHHLQPPVGSPIPTGNQVEDAGKYIISLNCALVDLVDYLPFPLIQFPLQ